MNFQPPSKSLTTRDYLFITFVLIIVVAISIGLMFANRSLPKGGGEFLRHWAGARAFVFEHIDPYTSYAPEIVQGLVYGHKAGTGEDPYILDSPFHLVLLYFPFSLISDPLTARTIYTLLLEWALFAFAILSLRLTEWTVPRWFAVLFFLFAVVNFYSFQAILDASPVLLLALFYAGIIAALRNEQDELAGALMSVSLYFWEAGLPFLLLIAWRCYKEGRTRVLAGFAMISIVLLAVSFMIYPNWIIPYLRAGLNALRSPFGFSIFGVFESMLPRYGRFLGWGMATLFIIVLGYEWNALAIGDSRRLYWVACLTLAVTPLLGFRSELENLSVLILPLAFIFAIVYDRWNRVGALLTFLLLLLILFGPWALYFFAPPSLSLYMDQILYLFLPVFTVVGLYWIRWWAIRPPRVWADSLMRNK